MRKPYPRALTDAQWGFVRPLIPVYNGGRPREVDMREGLHALLSLNRSGCPWDMPPHDLPAKSIVSEDFGRWRDDGTWQAIRDALRPEVRRAAGRDPNPSAGSSDRPTVKATELAADRGPDGGKTMIGRKRHIIVESLGWLIVVLVTGASADDGTIAPEILKPLTAEHRTRRKLLGADETYHNHHLNGWLKETEAGDAIEVVSRPPGSVGFVKRPRRWVVERSAPRGAMME